MPGSSRSAYKSRLSFSIVSPGEGCVPKMCFMVMQKDRGAQVVYYSTKCIGRGEWLFGRESVVPVAGKSQVKPDL